MKRLALSALVLPIALVASHAQSLAAAPANATANESATPLPAWAASLPSDDDITDARRDAIQHEAHEFVRTAPASATRELLGHLAGATARCGRAHSAALSGAMAAGIDPVDVAAALESASTECNEVVVESVAFVPNPDRNVAVALLRKTHDASDEYVRTTAWLAYGSIGVTARTKGNAELAASVDAVLANRLAETNGEEHVLAVRAAGNAGCEACAPILATDASSPDDRLRRTAVAAQRFLGTKDSVARMCNALAGDADATTRDLAAWSLEWRANDGAERARCLEQAATSDRSKGVRLQAVRALGILADDVPEAHDALGRIAERNGETGAIAQRTLDVHKGGEAADGEENRMVMR